MKKLFLLILTLYNVNLGFSQASIKTIMIQPLLFIQIFPFLLFIALLYIIYVCISLVIGQHYFHLYKPSLIKRKINSYANPYPEWNEQNLTDMAIASYLKLQHAFSLQDTRSIDNILTNTFAQLLDNQIHKQRKLGVYNHIEDIQIHKTYLMSYSENKHNKSLTMNVLFEGTKIDYINSREKSNPVNRKPEPFRTVIKFYCHKGEWYIAGVKDNPLGIHLIY